MSPLEKICFSFIPTEKRGFLPHRKPPSSEGSASVPGPQYLRRMHGMHRHRIQTSHRDCLPPPRSVPGAPESGRSWPNFHLPTNACRTVHKIPVWMAGFQRNERSAVCHCKKRFPGPAPIWWNNPAELPFQNPCPAPHPWY